MFSKIVNLTMTFAPHYIYRQDKYGSNNMNKITAR